MMFLNLFLYFLLPLLALGKAHNVAVGKGGLKFVPDVVHAKKGDTVHFHIIPGADHGVAQGEYSKPCQPFSGGFWSGFHNSATTFTVKITNTRPKFVYCPQNGHCQSGMGMVINPGHGQSIKSYQARSARTSSSGHQKHVGGGKLSGGG